MSDKYMWSLEADKQQRVRTVFNHLVHSKFWKKKSLFEISKYKLQINASKHWILILFYFLRNTLSQSIFPIFFLKHSNTLKSYKLQGRYNQPASVDKDQLGEPAQAPMSKINLAEYEWKLIFPPRVLYKPAQLCILLCFNSLSSKYLYIKKMTQ